MLDVDLSKYPDQIEETTSDNMIAIGDTHANSMKVLYFLVSKGVLKLKNDDYAELCGIYKKKVDYLPKDDLELLKWTLTKDDYDRIEVIKTEDDLDSFKKSLTKEDYDRFKETLTKKQLVDRFKGFLTEDEDAFDRFKNILTEEDLDRFKSILADAEVSDNAPFILFLGDDLFDRGNNDYFVLKIYEKLSQANVNFTVQHSDHGMEFWQAFNKDFKDFVANIKPDSARSYHNLKNLMDKGLVQKEEIQGIVERHYKPYTKLVSYEIHRGQDGEKDKIYISMHAPCGMETVKALAKYYGIEFKNNSVDELAAVTNEINAAFQLELELNEVDKHFEADCTDGDDIAVRNILGRAPIAADKSPVVRALWNRVLGSNYFQNQCDNIEVNDNKNFEVHFRHGHDASTQQFYNQQLLNILKAYFISHKAGVPLHSTKIEDSIEKFIIERAFNWDNPQESLSIIYKDFISGFEQLPETISAEVDLDDFYEKTELPNFNTLDSIPDDNPLYNFLYRYINASAEEKPFVSFAENVENYDNESGKGKNEETGEEVLSGGYHVRQAQKGEVAEPKEIPLAKLRRLSKEIEGLNYLGGSTSELQKVKQDTLEEFFKDYSQKIENEIVFLINYNQTKDFHEQNSEEYQPHIDRLDYYLRAFEEQKHNFRNEQHSALSAYQENFKILKEDNKKNKKLVVKINSVWSQFEKFIKETQLSRRVSAKSDEKKRNIDSALDRLKKEKYQAVMDLLKQNKSFAQAELFNAWLNHEVGDDSSLNEAFQTQRRGSHSGELSPNTYSAKQVTHRLSKMSDDQMLSAEDTDRHSLPDSHLLNSKDATAKEWKAHYENIIYINDNYEKLSADNISTESLKSLSSSIQEQILKFEQLVPLARLEKFQLERGDGGHPEFNVAKLTEIIQDLKQKQTSISQQLEDLATIDRIFKDFKENINDIKFSKFGDSSAKRQTRTDILASIEENRYKIVAELLNSPDNGDTLSEQVLFNAFLEHKPNDHVVSLNTLFQTHRFGVTLFGKELGHKKDDQSENTQGFTQVKAIRAKMDNTDLGLQDDGFKQIASKQAVEARQHVNQ